jgi:MinD-like ATPase involved in chromosome partitioning or flagellar assembly/CheY-like chemotaxis protein
MPEKKILVIDAEAASRNFVARKLIEKNYQAMQTGAGKEGLIFAWRDRPDLVIVDPALADLRGEDVALKLKNDPRSAAIPLIALSSDASPERRKSCLEAGFDAYIVKSGQAIAQLDETIHRLLGLAGGAMKRGGALIVFLSAKGGAGTSSLCANIAMNIAQAHPEADVAVADLVLPIGSIASIVGYEGDRNIVTVTDLPAEHTTPEFFRGELPEIEVWHFSLLAGSPDPESSNQLKVERIWDVIAALRAAFDFVLVDAGRALSKITLPIIQHADVTALVISTDASALPLTGTLLTFLRNKGVHTNAIYAILNRAVGLEGLSKADVENSMDVKIKAAMPYLGTNFPFANSQHQPFTLKFPKDSASIIFQDIAAGMAALAQKSRA